MADGTPADARIDIPVAAYREDMNAATKPVIEEMRAKGMTHLRATLIEDAGIVAFEGWNVRPELEAPPPGEPR